MNPKIVILYPSIAMALLTLGLLLAMGLRRFLAIQARAVSIKYYRIYTEGSEPDAMRRHSRHVQNHFEVPPLFHLALFGIYMAGEVTTATLAAAWLFVATRCLHAVIHLGYNNVSHRFLVFGLGVFTVVFLWVKLLASVVA